MSDYECLIRFKNGYIAVAPSELPDAHVFLTLSVDNEVISAHLTMQDAATFMKLFRTVLDE